VTPEQFCYWLQGFFEVAGSDDKLILSEQRVQVIRDHLTLVLDKRTPERQALSDFVRSLPSDPKRIC